MPGVVTVKSPVAFVCPLLSEYDVPPVEVAMRVRLVWAQVSVPLARLRLVGGGCGGLTTVTLTVVVGLLQAAV